MIQDGHLPNYVNGKWQHSRTGVLADVRNPATAETIVRVPLSSRDEVDEAVRAAQSMLLPTATWPVSLPVAAQQPGSSAIMISQSPFSDLYRSRE
jgi:hypothetical protein